MRENPILAVAIVIIAILLIDLYAYKGVRLLISDMSSTKQKWITIFYWLVPVILIVMIIVIYLFQDATSETMNYNVIFLLTGFFILFYLPKLSFIAFHLIEDIMRMFAFILKKLSPEESTINGVAQKIGSIRFLTQAGVVVASIYFVSIAYGMKWGRYNFKVRHEKIEFSHLPKVFDGLRVVQLSDMHLGSFIKNYDKVSEAINLINKQKPDIIVFTGDMVNNLASEMEGWVPIISKLEAKIGMYSVLGNHDYGHYHTWDTKEAEDKNLSDLVDYQAEMGFTLLRNQSAVVEKEGYKIAIVGVENWGERPFPQYGDYNLATQDVRDIPFKILLSHDPTHWSNKIADKEDVALTLSGHTHGMQMGIEIGSLRFSPVSLKYKNWGGLYGEEDQYLYVNIGFGFVGFPGRVGTRPEITVIDLIKKK